MSTIIFPSDQGNFFEKLGLEISLVGRDRFLVPFETHARHVGNVEHSVTNFVGLLHHGRPNLAIPANARFR